jgi:hypothetical protein
VVLPPRSVNGTEVFNAIKNLPEDFMADGREDTPPKERESIQIEDLQVKDCDYRNGMQLTCTGDVKSF